MIKVSHITQDLLAFGLEKNIYRRVFYRFLKYFCPPQADFGRVCVENFYSTLARFNNWQAVQKQVDSYMEFELGHLAKRYKLNFKPRVFLNRQLCVLNNLHDVQQLLHTRFQKFKNTKVRFLDSRQVRGPHLVMLIKPYGGFKIESYTNKAFVVGGRLQCLGPGVQLYYGPQFELMAQQKHFYWCPIMGWAVFEQKQNAYQGLLIQGPQLKPHKFVAPFKAPYSDLFYAIKHAEKFFIDSASDPFYQAVFKKIHTALQALRLRHPDGRALACEVLREVVLAQNLFDHHASIQNALCDLKEQLSNTPSNHRHLSL